jgi:hypothetical protein
MTGRLGLQEIQVALSKPRSRVPQRIAGHILSGCVIGLTVGSDSVAFERQVTRLCRLAMIPYPSGTRAADPTGAQSSAPRAGRRTRRSQIKVKVKN